VRIGQGFDAHRLVAGRPLRLAGVDIPHDRGLEGHSDGDVVLHAVTDAILGAIGAGDIGQHFSDTDPRWKEADSALFVGHAAQLARQRGYGIGNVDVTVILERPKLAPHREAMAARLAEALEIVKERPEAFETRVDPAGPGEVARNARKRDHCRGPRGQQQPRQDTAACDDPVVRHPASPG